MKDGLAFIYPVYIFDLSRSNPASNDAYCTLTVTVADPVSAAFFESTPVTLKVYWPEETSFPGREQAMNPPIPVRSRKTASIALQPRRRAGMPQSRQQASTALPVPIHRVLLPLLLTLTPLGRSVPLPKIST